MILCEYGMGKHVASKAELVEFAYRCYDHAVIMQRQILVTDVEVIRLIMSGSSGYFFLSRPHKY